MRRWPSQLPPAAPRIRPLLAATRAGRRRIRARAGLCHMRPQRNPSITWRRRLTARRLATGRPVPTVDLLPRQAVARTPCQWAGRVLTLLPVPTPPRWAARIHQRAAGCHRQAWADIQRPQGTRLLPAPIPPRWAVRFQLRTLAETRATESGFCYLPVTILFWPKLYDSCIVYEVGYICRYLVPGPKAGSGK